MNTRVVRSPNAVHGVVALDKPSGPTSFDVVAQVRRAYGTKAVGHAGTLDPLATGVLVVMLGEATKLSEYLTAQDKEYVAEIAFGRSTDTLDVTGETVESRTVHPSELSLDAIEAALGQERARRMQEPPAHSAIKIDGQPAYARVRRGESFSLALRPVAVSSLTLQGFVGNTLTVSLRVSKGYYVRSLVRDLCERLKVPGCMSALRRTASGCFHIDTCARWPVSPAHELPVLMSISQAVQQALPCAILSAESVLRARQGKRLTPNEFETLPQESVAAWLDPEHKLVALGERVEPPDFEPYYRVLRGFNTTVA